MAAVVDDLASVDPRTPRGIEIRGRVSANMPFDAAWLRVRPRRIPAWGIDGGPFILSARDVA